MSLSPSAPRSPSWVTVPSALRRILLALVVTAALVSSGVVTQSVAAQGPTSSEQRPASGALGKTDRRLGPRSCALLGRSWTAQGCSRTTCSRTGDVVRTSPNAEVCMARSAAYGRVIDVRVCRTLHRRWIAEVNLCASNPARRSKVVRAARQCWGATSDYVMVRERPGLWDECVTPARRRQLERIAAGTGTPLWVVAGQRSPTLCALRAPTAYVDGVCRAAAPADTAGRPRGTLLIGDSLSWRSQDELGGLRPRWTLDGLPGRGVDRIDRLIRGYLKTHVAPATLVMALGTNPSASWRKQDYLDATALLPERTRVVLVTPYRGPRSKNAAVAAPLTRSYDRWLREIAASRPRTCLADWRAQAINRPGMLIDGIHPSSEGENVWAQLISSSWDTCQAV